MYCRIPPATTLSVAWKGGAREEDILELRKRMVDCWEMRRGRKAWTVVKGARRWVFSASDQIEGVKEEIGLEVWFVDGRRTKPVS